MRSSFGGKFNVQPTAFLIFVRFALAPLPPAITSKCFAQTFFDKPDKDEKNEANFLDNWALGNLTSDG